MNEMVSVIMASYNTEDFIIDSIYSVLNQSYTNLELIIIDDSSIDNTLSVIDTYIKDSRLKVIKNNFNKGPAYSRNKGIESSSGRYIAFIDSDDLWDEDFLTEQVNFIEENAMDLVFASYRRKSYDLKEDLGEVYCA